MPLIKKAKSYRIGDVAKSSFNEIKRGGEKLKRLGRIGAWEPKIPTGGYVKPTSVYDRRFGAYITSDAYVYKDKPKDYEFLGARGVMGVSGKSGSVLGRTKLAGLPSPKTFKSFSDYFVQENKLKENGFDFIKNKEGIITSIKAKPQEYTSRYYKSRSGRSKDTSKATYIPREIIFDDKGNIVKDITRRDYESYDERYKGSKDRKRSVYDRVVKEYKDNVLAKEIEREAYLQRLDSDSDGREEQRAVRLGEVKDYSQGVLAKEVKYSDYLSDVKSTGGDKYYKPYKEKEYDYLRGIGVRYGRPETDIKDVTETFTRYTEPAQVKVAWSEAKAIKDTEKSKQAKQKVISDLWRSAGL